jgi:hypothetical protein
VAEEKFHSWSDALANGARWLVVSETDHQEQFEELSLLRASGAELCFTIIGPSQVRIPLSARMRAAALHHTKMVGELATLRAAVSSTAERCWGTHLVRPLGWKL